MRIVGKKHERPVQATASAELLISGARFNDEIHRLPGGERTGIRKGVYRFANHDDANEHDAASRSEYMSHLINERAAKVSK